MGKSAGRLDPLAAAIAGLAFAFSGAILAAPERHQRMRASLGALMITCVALLFDWLAFGPGDRHIASAVSNGNLGVRTHVWEVPGRVLLASGAVLFTLMAMWAWIRTRRVQRRKTARA